jgi:hypothetical protein
MTTHMVRKQLYIHKRHNALLKQLSQARGVSEAEIVRQAIEHEALGASVKPASPDPAAWEALTVYLDSRVASLPTGKPYRWNRQDLYTERGNRLLRDRDED